MSPGFWTCARCGTDNNYPETDFCSVCHKVRTEDDEITVPEEETADD